MLSEKYKPNASYVLFNDFLKESNPALSERHKSTYFWSLRADGRCWRRQI